MVKENGMGQNFPDALSSGEERMNSKKIILIILIALFLINNIFLFVEYKKYQVMKEYTKLLEEYCDAERCLFISVSHSDDRFYTQELIGNITISPYSNLELYFNFSDSTESKQEVNKS